MEIRFCLGLDEILAGLDEDIKKGLYFRPDLVSLTEPKSIKYHPFSMVGKKLVSQPILNLRFAEMFGYSARKTKKGKFKLHGEGYDKSYVMACFRMLDYFSSCGSNIAEELQDVRHCAYVYNVSRMDWVSGNSGSWYELPDGGSVITKVYILGSPLNLKISYKKARPSLFDFGISPEEFSYLFKGVF